MDFDTAKENIQPLASGRNAEHLETALIAESDHEIQQKLYEQRKEFERMIETYSGEDPLQPWYDYIVWVEQIYPKSGKESALHELLAKCLALFERDERYFQDRRMVKLYIKYIDSEPNPPQFYEQLYNNGIGTMVADLYLCWAHYYDCCDNFEKAESIYRKGLDARAQPIDLIEQAHKQFGFLMSQRLLYKDESTQRQFRSSMEEQRLALTSLRAHRHRHVGSIRTGSAIKSLQPGRVEQHDLALQQSNRKVHVFEDAGVDAPTSPTASTSVVQSILNSTKKQENLREPGPWNKAKIKTHALFSGSTSTSKPSFPILVDDDFPPIPLPDSENNYARGIQLPKDFVRRNSPQDEFLFPIHRDEDPAKNTIYRYDKFMVFPAPDKSYSLEELWAYKWLKKRNIKNNFTRTQDAVWGNGYGIPIRLPPHFVRKNTKSLDDWTPEPINYEDALANGHRKFGFKIDLFYAPNEEFSMEEILQAKWLNGELLSQKETEMDFTCDFERRIEISNRNANRRSMVLGGRKSILPHRPISPRQSISARKSLAPPALPEVIEEPQPISMGIAATAAVGAISRTCLPKRKSIYTAHTLETLTTIPETETASPPNLRRKIDEDNDATTGSNWKPNPVPFNIFEDGEQTENNEQIFKVPQSAPLQKTRFSTGFQDEDLDGCTTQTFNFFIKSQAISTPKVEKQHAKLAEPESVAALQKGLDFGSDCETSPGDEQNAVKQPFACRSIDVDQPYVIEQHEMYRQKLSAIMETTEECATVSSLATASSKSSSAEDFDFTKNTNHQSSVAMSTYRQQTIINNTAKMSSSNVSVTNRTNETKKGLGFEIYQEDAAKGNDTVTSQVPTHVSKMADSSAAMGLQSDSKAFDKTLPAAAQFHIYEDEDTKKLETSEMKPNAHKADTTLVNKPDCPDAKQNQSVFEMSQGETVPSAWNSKATSIKNVSYAPNKSIMDPVGSKELKLTTAGVLPPAPPKSGFNVLQEDTGLTMPAINFAEERTVQLPIFNQTNVTQMMPPEKTETMSMFIPEIPDMPDDDATNNMSKIFKNHACRVEPTQAINQSTVYNQSVFQFPAEDTVTNVFSTNFNDDKLETNPSIPNPMQISLFNAGGNTSAIPMIPDMPTLPEMDFQTEVLSNKSAAAANQSKLNLTTAGGNKTNAEQSLFYGFTTDTQSKVSQGQTFKEQYTNDLSKINHSKQANTSVQAQAVQNKSMAQNGLEDSFADSSIANKTTAKSSQIKRNIDDEFFAMVNRTKKQSPATNQITMDVEHNTFIEPIASVSTVPTVHVSPEKVSPTTLDNNQSIFSKSKHTIDDEFYAMIRSPVRKTDRTLAEGMIVLDTPSPAAPPFIRQTMNVDVTSNPHKIVMLQNPSTSSLLEPMKNASLQLQTSAQNTQITMPTNRKSSFDDVPRAFSEENPNTAMFSLHMPFIKNSTILMASNENINNISDELKTNFTLNEETSVAKAQEDLIEKNAEKLPNASIKGLKETLNRSEFHKEPSVLKLDSIHIKEERFSVANKTVGAAKLHISIDDEIYECIQEKSRTETNPCFNLSIQLTEAELASAAPSMEIVPRQTQINQAPEFMICNPVSIRPSQFPMNATNMNETTAHGETNMKHESLKNFQLDISKLNQTNVEQVDTSVILIEEDTDDMSAACKSLAAANRTRRETMANSPFKNHFATNPKLNETINAVKEIDPFDMHLQNAFLDDIDFVEYIKSLENVQMTTRVRPIEVDTDVQIGSETFHIVKQIGQGSFGFVFSGKSAKTGKMYALKQERPANLWEFYISLEIPARVIDANIFPGFMSMEHAIIGHNSSIFVTELSEYGSLFDVCNRHKLNTCRYLDEVIAMIFSEQMLSILDHLHASNIIHGDLKPDNFLLMKRLSYGNNEIVLKLIDYGRSIDLNFFPPNQTFTTALNTKNFICTEILENRPWKQQIDLFCLASTIYTLVCGKYMNIKKQPDSLIRPYALADNWAAYLDVPLWEHVLYSLINVRDHNSLPDLQKLRLRIRESIVEKEHIVQDRIAKFNAILDA